MKRQHTAPVPRGAATLVVVLVLFFVVSLVAAYTSRSLIFEQRTSANQYRATLASEAAEAGVEWVLTRLNQGRMNGDSCEELASAAAVNSATPEPTFRERYLQFDPTNGNISPVADRLAGCAFDGSAWQCHCPDTGEPAPTLTPTGNGPFPAFWVRFRFAAADPSTATAAERARTVYLQVNACTRNDRNCLNFGRDSQVGEAIASHFVLLGLKTGLAALPAAALTLRGDVQVELLSNLELINFDLSSGGLTVHTASTLPAGLGGLILRGPVGTPVEFTVARGDSGLLYPDVTLSGKPEARRGVNRMFHSTFGFLPSELATLPGVALIDCSSGCAAGEVNSARLLRPGHIVWAQGSGTLQIDADIGSATDPVVLISDGPVQFTVAGAQAHGLVYSRATTWNFSGQGTVNGALMGEHELRAFNNNVVRYAPDILHRARAGTGTFARAPGGWKDFVPEP